VRDSDSDTEADETEAGAAESSTWAILTTTMLIAYFPLFFFTLWLLVAAIAGLAILCYKVPPLVLLGIPLGLVFLLTLARLLWAARVLFYKIPDHEDEMEMRVPPEMAPELYHWVDRIAADRSLPQPDEIRVAADTVAHVYQRRNGKQVLVLGAIAIRALPQPVLAGIVAHELGHVDAGDTGRGRASIRAHILMAHVEANLRRRDRQALRRGRRSNIDALITFVSAAATVLNPAVWPLAIYHIVYALAQAEQSRQQEYAADRHEVEQSGAEAAAAALILLTVSQQMPWTRLSSLASAWAETTRPPRELFSEQASHMRALDPSDWRDALRKEMKKATGYFDSHPGLKDRLEAMGISPKQASKLTPQLSGPPSEQLFGAWWPKLEERLAERLIEPFREAHLAMMELGELVTGLQRAQRGRAGLQ
jgi:Zn-dependent protease with chaperone function